MQPSRLFLAFFLLVQLVLAACGGGGGSTATEPAPGSTTGGTDAPATTLATGTTADAGSGGVGDADSGTLQFEISGNWDKAGEMVFIPEASVFTDGYWNMSFAPNRDGSGDAVFTINLHPDVMVFTYGDPEFTVTGGPDQCQFNIDGQSADGVSGTIECTNLTGIPAASAMTDGVNLSASFDARN